MYNQKSSYYPSASAPPPRRPPAAAYGQPVSGVPAAYGQQLQSEGAWSTGLCGCFEDVPNCCLTCWCPCITFGQIADIVDEGVISCVANGTLYTLILMVSGCACCYSCGYRSKMREQYALRESPCIDCLTHCCCELCALCQEHRELKNRGFIMSLGWQGNDERQNRGDVGMVNLPPPRGQRMNR